MAEQGLLASTRSGFESRPGSYTPPREVGMKAAWKTGCDTSACVRVLIDEDKDMVLIESTVFGPTGVYDLQEWNNFKQAVKDGKFD